MPKILQFLGDVYNVAKSYVGATREIRLDISNWDILLHDGATPGGHRFLNQDNADKRYQHSSGEISGISGFLPSDVGMLTRTGDATYAVRVLQSANSDLVWTNPDGVLTNPTLTLADTFAAQKTFTNGVVLNGNSTLAAGKTLTASGAIAGIGTLSMNVDVSSKTLTLAANQIPTTAINGLNAYVQTNGVPIGSIVMWSGAAGSVPAGWHICDGGTYNGITTPDMRDLFVAGAGSTYAVGNTGGFTTATAAITVNGHVLTTGETPYHDHSYAQSPHAHVGSGDTGHSHTITWGGYGQYAGQGGPGIAGYTAGATVSVQTLPTGTDTGYANIAIAPDYANISFAGVGGNGAHTHGASATTTDNRPPFRALYFIMHVGP